MSPFFVGIPSKYINNFNFDSQSVCRHKLEKTNRRNKMPIVSTSASANGKVNGLGATTHILSVTDVSTTNIDAIRLEANAEGFTVVAVEASNNGAMQDGDIIAVQGTGTPSITGTSLVGTFQQSGD